MTNPRSPSGVNRTSDTADMAEDLADEMLACYLEWRRDAASVRDAYKEWTGGSTAEAAARFSAYLVALEREESSASRYALVLADAEGAAEPYGARHHQ
jgi:hypothetical protein